jgi:hypothetical protein
MDLTLSATRSSELVVGRCGTEHGDLPAARAASEARAPLCPADDPYTAVFGVVFGDVAKSDDAIATRSLKIDA